MAEEREIVIVGGGPAAYAAASAYRDAGGALALRILAAELELPYERPPLTKDYLRGKSSRSDLLLAHADWYRDHGVEVECDAEVTELDLEAGEARGHDGRNWRFDRCLLATGARPLLPEIPGADGPDVRTVRTIADAEQLHALAECSVLVAGSGFIGCEAAASLAMLGAEVTLATLEEAPQEERFGPRVAERIGAWLAELGVDLLAGASLTEIVANSGGSVARFEDGREHGPDAAVVLALGITRNDELAAAAGVAVDDGVLVDAAMRSSNPRLLACGDVAAAQNAAAGRRLRVEHWGEALNMGKVAGHTLAACEASWEVAPGFWSTIGGRTLKYAGWGDGWDEVRFEPGDGDAFVSRYGRAGELVGVLAHEDDEAYERGRAEIEARAPWS
jgi:NAD(P)H-nitrite reductase large subunit